MATPPHTLQREPGTALHRQLFMVLRDQIQQGRFAPGDAIPTEDELGAAYGVSRITVRRAVSDLESQGLVEKQPGRGTFVTGVPSAPRRAVTLGLLDSLAKQASDTTVQVLQVEHAPAPPAVAAQLGLAPRQVAVHASRLRLVRDVPVMVTEAWVPEAVGQHVSAALLKKRALYEILLDAGVRFGRVIQEVTALTADPRLATLLRTDIGAPLLRITRLLHDEQARPVQHLTIHITAERSRLLMDVAADEMNSLVAGQIAHDDDAVRAVSARQRAARTRR